MKRKGVRLTALALSAVCLLSLAGCGREDAMRADIDPDTPASELIDKYMPNLQAVFEKYPEYRTMCTAPDGHIYSFPWIEQLGEGKEAI